MKEAGRDAAFRMLGCAPNGISHEGDTLTMPFGVSSSEWMAVFLEVYGYWLGDGSLQFKAGTGTDVVMFTIVKPQDVEWLVASLDSMGVAYKFWGRDSYEKRIAVVDPAWIALFHNEYRTKYALGDELCKRASTVAGRKKKEGPPKPYIGVKSAKWFASWVWDLDKDSLRIIIRGLRRADGCEKTSQSRIFTSSTHFRDELVQLCLHAGYVPRFGKLYDVGAERGVSRAGTSIVARHAAWYVSYADGANNGAFSRPVVRGTDITAHTRTCRTWCVVVPHGFIITRRAVVDDSGVVVQASVPIVVHNCLISHGAAAMMQDRLNDNSDPCIATICGKKECGLLAQPASQHTYIRNKEAHCKNCGDSACVKNMRCPFAFKLLLQELMAMGIATRLELE